MPPRKQKSKQTTRARASRRPAAETASTEGIVTTSDDTVEILPAPVPDALIDQVQAELNELTRSSGFELANAVGKLLVDRFYGGELAAWRDRGQKDASFRKLADRAEKGELHMSAAGLYRSVAIYELGVRLGVSTWKHLTVSHLRAVLGLPEGQQVKLLTDADNKGWTVAEMEKAASRIRKNEAGGRGRPPLPAFVKGIHRLGKLLDEDEGWFTEFEKVEELDEKDALSLYQTVTGMKIKCEELQKKLEQRAGMR